MAVVACKMMRSAKVPTAASSACPLISTLRCLKLSGGRGEEAAWLGLVAEGALDRHHLVCLGYQDAKERAKERAIAAAAAVVNGSQAPPSLASSGC